MIASGGVENTTRQKRTYGGKVPRQEAPKRMAPKGDDGAKSVRCNGLRGEGSGARSNNARFGKSFRSLRLNPPLSKQRQHVGGA